MPASTTPPGGVDVDLDVAPAVLGRQQQQLRADPVGEAVVDLLPDEHDPLAEQPLEQLVLQDLAGGQLGGAR
jgi:hypothetical protein